MYGLLTVPAVRQNQTHTCTKTIEGWRR